ncbi:PSD1 and planctomycete cytochrome C domain-containing protein [Lentisphaera profundi]|uniref:PSD1 and planctomycete cytochrome C domain-containing protein n=1 Tax=Lentisphaera profundi TaxID=1658616 RepID=A0ABY7VWP8_9BACT|nr:PSD1 and planctomycete cytochrome C domain-containing protein [Lentisphaera profundi]WDE97694.1 PSD1 and planctomycete cytochrome C domain-containing protein [Lentisphaera profundi]
MKTKLTFISLLICASELLANQGYEFFETHIRPVLAESCYDCHNSLSKEEGGKKKGGLALDWKEPFLEGGDWGDTLIPGNSKDSFLMASIRHEEEDMEMPAKAPKLSPEVIANFAKWIDMGAPDPRTTKPTKKDLENAIPWATVRDKRAKWWSFEELKNHPVPKVKNTRFQKSPIDAFVAQKQEENELVPLGKAKPETLIRRASLVLIGLPPDYQDVLEFKKNPSQNNFEKYVDKLLNSPEFGERWARHWMDWYRFANTHGSEGDPVIPYADVYRDYLVRALNDDISYEQLLTEHIAGDLLKSPRINKELKINESAIGPAHFRMNPYGFGVTDAYAEQVTATDNQIDVVSKAMLGITVSCARCHHHKFDPISQDDFHRFYGVLDSTKIGNVIINTPDQLEINKKEIAELKKEIHQELADYWLTQKYDFKALHQRANQTIAISKAMRKKHAKKRSKKEVALFEKEREQKLFLERSKPFDLLKFRNNKELQNKLSRLKIDLKSAVEHNAKLRASADLYLDFGKQSDLDKLRISGNSTANKVSPAGSFALFGENEYAVTGIYPRGVYSHLISDKHAAVLMSNNFRATQKGIWLNSVGGKSSAKTPVRNYPLSHGLLHPTHEFKEQDGSKWFSVNRKWDYWRDDRLHFEIRTAKDAVHGPRKSDRSWFGMTELIIAEDAPRNIPINFIEILGENLEIKNEHELLAAFQKALIQSLNNWKQGKASDAEAKYVNLMLKEGLLNNELASMPPKLQKLIQKYRDLEKEIIIPQRAPGLHESEVVNSKLFVRGDYKKESHEVPRGFLEVFSDKKYNSENSGRLQLAQDITSDTNSLKSRVLVNRLWNYVFGNGIVTSTDNFGLLGKKPTHPELLDYLALDFEENNWSIKTALRKMVTSQTFQLSSEAAEINLEKDPLNTYLTYYTPRRLDVEAIKDSLHYVGGKNYRTMHHNIIRNSLDKFNESFDFPVPMTTMSKRNITNVPAQALLLMNGPIAKNMSNHLTKIAEQETKGKGAVAYIIKLYNRLYGRSPEQAEIDACLEYLKSHENNELSLALLNSKEFIYVY